jgi:hypothetical protein
MLRAQLQSGLAHVVLALREPEEFARRWHGHEGVYSRWVFGALAMTAILGTLTYGLTMGLLGGPRTVALGGLRCTAAAGLAWGIALPSLYIFNSLSGSRLRASTTLLAALVTTSPVVSSACPDWIKSANAYGYSARDPVGASRGAQLPPDPHAGAMPPDRFFHGSSRCVEYLRRPA